MQGMQTEVRMPFRLMHAMRKPIETAASNVGEISARIALSGLPIEEARHAKPLSHCCRRLPCERDALIDRSCQRDERYDIDCADSRVHPFVMTKIDSLDRCREQAQHRRLKLCGLCHERIDRPVVRRIGRLIEQTDARRCNGSRHRRDDIDAASLADVRDALDEWHSPLVSQLILPHNFDADLAVRAAVPTRRRPADDSTLNMSDPLRTVPINEAKTPATDADAERDAKIESLLLAGLDQYFAADYAQAIDIWTRALFLDRGHARARAYIERARSAMAEEQRESEELLHKGIAAFERGEIEAARELLNAAVRRGGAHDVALAFLTRIDRISAAAPVPQTPSAVPARRPFRTQSAPSSRKRFPWAGAALLIALLLIAMGVVAASWDELRVMVPVLRNDAHGDLAPAKAALEPLLVPRSAETAMARARALHSAGRLYDALRAVELVRPTDPLRPDADRLKAAIQLDLLAYQTSGAAPASSPRSQ